MRKTTNRSEDNQKVIKCESAEPALGLAPLHINAQTGRKNFKRYGNDVASNDSADA